MNRSPLSSIAAVLLLFCLVAAVSAEDDIKELKLRDWKPTSMLKTKVSRIHRPAHPAIDVHNHLGGGKEKLTPEQVKKYLDAMDEAGHRRPRLERA
jgi:hypothetical protein